MEKLREVGKPSVGMHRSLDLKPVLLSLSNVVMGFLQFFMLWWAEPQS